MLKAAAKSLDEAKENEDYEKQYQDLIAKAESLDTQSENIWLQEVNIEIKTDELKSVTEQAQEVTATIKHAPEELRKDEELAALIDRATEFDESAEELYAKHGELVEESKSKIPQYTAKIAQDENNNTIYNISGDNGSKNTITTDSEGNIYIKNESGDEAKLTFNKNNQIKNTVIKKQNQSITTIETDENKVPFIQEYEINSNDETLVYEQGIDCDLTYRRFAENYKREHYNTWVDAREGNKALHDKVLPYIKRDISKIEVGDVIIGDGHRLAFFVKHPYTGKPVRPLMVAYQEWKSGGFVGFEIMLEENTQCIASALRNSIINLGKVPKFVYMDNGKAFKAKYFIENGISGLFTNLGIQAVFANAYNAKAKPISLIRLGIYSMLKRAGYDLSSVEDIIKEDKIIDFNCEYSRPGDNGARWDAIIIDETRSIPIEIKSPTEEMHLSVKAIRQALENKIILLSRKTHITDKNTTSLAVGYCLPNDRAEVSSLVENIKETYGYKIGVLDFKSLLTIAISILVDNKGFDKKDRAKITYKYTPKSEIAEKKKKIGEKLSINDYMYYFYGGNNTLNVIYKNEFLSILRMRTLDAIRDVENDMELWSKSPLKSLLTNDKIINQEQLNEQLEKIQNEILDTTNSFKNSDIIKFLQENIDKYLKDVAGVSTIKTNINLEGKENIVF